MKFPYAKASIWLLFTLLASVSFLFGQNQFTVSMTEWSGGGNGDPNVLYSAPDPICLTAQNGVVTINFNPQLNLAFSLPENGTEFQLRASVYGIDPNIPVNPYAPISTAGFIPVPLIQSNQPIITQTGPIPHSPYHEVSAIISSQNSLVSGSVSLNFNFLNTDPVTCEYIVVIEVYSPSPNGNMIPYDPVDLGSPTFFYGNLQQGCEFEEEESCPIVYDFGISEGFGGSETSNERKANLKSELKIQSLYPNPATESITLSFNNLQTAEISILDLQGKIVSDLSQISKIEPGNHTIKLPVNHLSPGIYLVQVRSKSILKTHKFVVLE